VLVCAKWRVYLRDCYHSAKHKITKLHKAHKTARNSRRLADEIRASFAAMIEGEPIFSFIRLLHWPQHRTARV
jgi:hypothetical protein